MRFNLQLTYWCLISITIISSCFLFLVVASETSARNIGAAAKEDADVAKNGEGVGGARGGDVAASDDGDDKVNLDSKFINIKNENSASRSGSIKAKAVHSSLPIVHVEMAPSLLSVSSHTAAGDEGKVPSPAEYISEVKEKQVVASDDGSVLSDVDAVVVPISERNVLQLEAPQVRVQSEAAASDSSSEDIPVTIATPIDATSLPDISSENPTVIPLNEITSTDLPLAGGLEQHTLDPVIISKTESSTTNQTKDGDEIKTTEDDQKADDQIDKIDDSGGSIPPQPPDSNADGDADAAAADNESHIPSEMPTKANATITHEVNLTAEEVPIPVFSEWAQKQMEAAEKQQLEQDVVNSSAQKKNLTTGSKQQSAKLRTKNYASPDCGAKIIASNSDAQNTGAVLTASKDEYMLSPCTNRIWFVVELCEAIQAEKIDLANFELFSSSPKNFTVAVSNRFPTRDWSNVGRFIADDKRTIQSFELHPHLFGKFVRVDIHSHYNSEHFCPVSLFRVYGTSEFEAFETEDRAADDMDEYDDDEAFDRAHQKNENNLFKSASDAVLSIVKKAAEVLVKTNSNRTTLESKSELGCFTPSTGDFICTQCKDTSLAAKVNFMLSCRHTQLMNLLGIERLRSDIHTSQICAKRFSVNLDSHLDCKASSSWADEKSSYYLSLLPEDYVGAMCQLLAGRQKKSQNDSVDVGSEGEQNGEISLNLTIDKGNGGAFGTLEKLPEINEEQVRGKPKSEVLPNEEISAQIPPPPRKDEDIAAATERTETVPRAIPPAVGTLDINIYNLPEANHEKESNEKELPPVEVIITEELKSEELVAEVTLPPKVDLDSTLKPPAVVNLGDHDPSSWENLDTLLSEGVVTGTAATNSHGNQQKIPSGPHSESVFIRLNNRIKSLERNMSLSGQYLEELSRRYKKQVEELQLSLTKTVRALEDQNRHHSEQERALLDQNNALKDELDDVSLRVHACIILIIFVGSFMILLTVLGVVFYRSVARNPSPKPAEKRKSTQKKLNRRKSFDDFSDASTGKKKMRRPSEEALLIMKDSKAENPAPENDGKQRQRKLSVFYGRKANRKGEKRSWPEVSQPGEFNPGIEDLPPVEPATTSVLEDEEYDQFNASESDSICTSDQPPSNVRSASQKFSSIFNGRGNKKSKKNNFAYKRQESAPADICSPTSNNTTAESFDDKLILDEDDIGNFIPGTDLAYNEFMPDGPSGYQISDATKPEEARKNGKKSRRLSSPGFFKSPFGKSSKKSPPHEPTSWEWYRSKKSSGASITSSQQSKSSSKVNGFGLSAVHSQPSPASSLSEILPNSGQGSSDNSFRILEEAINTSTIATTSSSSNDKQEKCFG